MFRTIRLVLIVIVVAVAYSTIAAPLLNHYNHIRAAYWWMIP